MTDSSSRCQPPFLPRIYRQLEVDAHVAEGRSTAGHHEAGHGGPWAFASREIDDHVRSVDDLDESANDLGAEEALGERPRR
jgi:hypothetical protein